MRSNVATLESAERISKTTSEGQTVVDPEELLATRSVQHAYETLSKYLGSSGPSQEFRDHLEKLRNEIAHVGAASDKSTAENIASRMSELTKLQDSIQEIQKRLEKLLAR